MTDVPDDMVPEDVVVVGEIDHSKYDGEEIKEQAVNELNEEIDQGRVVRSDVNIYEGLDGQYCFHLTLKGIKRLFFNGNRYTGGGS